MKGRIDISRGNIIVICGPTASGKSYAAMKLAETFGGEIINADSVQIYKDVDIGSAKPSSADMEKVPHHLINIAELGQEFTVADYKKHAYAAADDILARGKIPIMCGGTGLYISHAVRNTNFAEYENDYSFREEAESKSNEELYEELKLIDPAVTEKIHVNNRQRVIRAIEIYRLTGLTKSEADIKAYDTAPVYNFKEFYLNYADRAKLYGRINMRVEKMLDDGLAEEIITIKNKGKLDGLKKINAIGYNELINFFDTHGYEYGKKIRSSSEFQVAVEEIKKNTRNYAKRQITWFGRNENSIRINIFESVQSEIDGIIDKMRII